MVFNLPVSRFFAMLDAMPKIQAEEDFRLLMSVAYGANPGEKGKQFDNYAKQLKSQMEGVRKVSSNQTIIPGITPGVSEVEGGLKEERRRKIEEWKKAREESIKNIGSTTS